MLSPAVLVTVVAFGRWNRHREPEKAHANHREAGTTCENGNIKSSNVVTSTITMTLRSTKGCNRTFVEHGHPPANCSAATVCTAGTMPQGHRRGGAIQEDHRPYSTGGGPGQGRRQRQARRPPTFASPPAARETKWSPARSFDAPLYHFSQQGSCCANHASHSPKT